MADVLAVGGTVAAFFLALFLVRGLERL